MNDLNQKRFSQPYGLTLFEVIVGLAATLIILLAMVQAFRFASVEMQAGRASLELTNRLRTTQNLLRADLRRLTVEAKSYYNLASAPKGYLEIADGPKVDINNLVDDVTTTDRVESTSNLIIGDYDDILAGTIQSEGRPFRGRGPGGTVIESPFAEVAWFTTFTDADNDGFAETFDGDQIRLFRRQLVISPRTVLNPLTGAGALVPITLNTVNGILQNTDVSARVVLVSVATATDPAFYNVIANSLEDLAFRGNRFAHFQPVVALHRDIPQNGVFSQVFLQGDPQYQSPALTFVHRRSSNQSDLILTDVAAFDIRVFEPNAVSLVKSLATVPSAPTNVVGVAEPSDIATRVSLVGTFDEQFGLPGIVGADTFQEENGTVEGGGTVAVTPTVGRTGAYVDLGKNLTAPAGSFEQTPATTPVLMRGTTTLRVALGFVDSFTFVNATGTTVTQPIAIYETGTPAYDRIPANSFGTNGIDDNEDPERQIDEFGAERISPPYSRRIRGIQVVVRLFEPNTKQVTQMTLKQSMLPQ